MKQTTGSKFILSMVMLGSAALSAQAQTSAILTAGLERPTKLIVAIEDSLLVAESGTAVPNSGRISVVNTTTGARQTLVAGLPSGLSNLGGLPEPSGLSGLVMRGRKLYVTIGSGGAMINVGPGLEAINPDPFSPLCGSVLELTLPGNFTEITEPFALSAENQTTLADGQTVVLANADGEQIEVRLVANLPDYMPNPRPGFPNNLRASNLFGVEIFQNELYVVDASFNLVYRVGIDAGEYSTLATFPGRPNPLFGTLGGPVIESVPDNIHRVGNRLLIPLLTGFPFVHNFSEIQNVSIKTGDRLTLIPGLTSAIDVLHAGEGRFYTLEFSANQLANQPGRVRFFSSPDATPVPVISNLVTPTSMAWDETTGNIFVSEIGTGRIIRIEGL